MPGDPFFDEKYGSVSYVNIAAVRLALTFGGSRSLSEIAPDQVRRFADTARLPMKPLWEIVRETVELTAERWTTLPHQELLPAAMLKIINEQIQRVVAATTAQLE